MFLCPKSLLYEKQITWNTLCWKKLRGCLYISRDSLESHLKKKMLLYKVVWKTQKKINVKKVILAVTSLLTNKVVVVTSDLLHLTANQVAGLGEGLRVWHQHIPERTRRPKEKRNKKSKKGFTDSFCCVYFYFAHDDPWAQYVIVDSCVPFLVNGKTADWSLVEITVPLPVVGFFL